MLTTIDHMNANVALASALILYPLIFRLVTPRDVSSGRFALSRETISAVHAALVSLAAALELYRQRDKWASPAYRSASGVKDELVAPQDGKETLDIINAQSPFGNAIIAWECGYLIQDSFVLLLGARRAPHDDRRSRSVMAKSFNLRVLGWHHFGVGSALGFSHFRALQGKAKGVLIVMIFFLMNLSYVPFLCLSHLQ